MCLPVSQRGLTAVQTPYGDSTAVAFTFTSFAWTLLPHAVCPLRASLSRRSAFCAPAGPQIPVFGIHFCLNVGNTSVARATGRCPAVFLCPSARVKVLTWPRQSLDIGGVKTLTLAERSGRAGPECLKVCQNDSLGGGGMAKKGACDWAGSWFRTSTKLLKKKDRLF